MSRIVITDSGKIFVALKGPRPAEIEVSNDPNENNNLSELLCNDKLLGLAYRSDERREYVELHEQKKDLTNDKIYVGCYNSIEVFQFAEQKWHSVDEIRCECLNVRLGADLIMAFNGPLLEDYLTTLFSSEHVYRGILRTVKEPHILTIAHTDYIYYLVDNSLKFTDLAQNTLALIDFDYSSVEICPDPVNNRIIVCLLEKITGEQVASGAYDYKVNTYMHITDLKEELSFEACLEAVAQAISTPRNELQVFPYYCYAINPIAGFAIFCSIDEKTIFKQNLF